MTNFLHSTLNDVPMEGMQGVVGNVKWHCPAQGILVFEPEVDAEASVVISAGIHGNETAPIEIVDQLISDILNERVAPLTRTMFVFGNIEAMKQDKRYLDVDMNRLFGKESAVLMDYPETFRAQVIEFVTEDFFRHEKSKFKIHLDLHTAIRPSFHERFGLLPYVEKGKYPRSFISFLSTIDLDAMVINHAPSTTYSYFTSHVCNADSVTLELGKALPFGENDLGKFKAIKDGMYRLISKTYPSSDHSYDKSFQLYRVSQVLIKKSDAFLLNFDDETPNFTSFSRGELLATDNNFEYRVEHDKEWVIFPNNNVRVGLRGGLMLVQDLIDDYCLNENP
ncbi:succinylglutamate desuccinylase [Vibrio sp.]|nr:succinylglutamate desuccinylase [Vibrio sp.]